MLIGLCPPKFSCCSGKKEDAKPGSASARGTRHRGNETATLSTNNRVKIQRLGECWVVLLQASSKPEETVMATHVKPVPDGYHTLAPYLVVDGAERIIQFMKNAFGAQF